MRDTNLEIKKLTPGEYQKLLRDYDFKKYAADLSARCEAALKAGTYRGPIKPPMNPLPQPF